WNLEVPKKPSPGVGEERTAESGQVKQGREPGKREGKDGYLHQPRAPDYGEERVNGPLEHQHPTKINSSPASQLQPHILIPLLCCSGM
ncbi:hypothetical protein E2320_022582, partial [Naja naja]